MYDKFVTQKINNNQFMIQMHNMSYILRHVIYFQQSEV